MGERLDHVVIGVGDLDQAVRDYGERLGFDVRRGGEHVGRGTHNALIRFGLDYLELLAVQPGAEPSDPSPRALAAFVEEHGGGLVGYGLATDDIAGKAAVLEREGLDAVGPFAMGRLRPDGRRLDWRLLVPGGMSWREPWPFFIQWDLPDAERLAMEAVGGHPNGVRGVREVAVVMEDLERGVDLYGRQLGLPLVSREEVVPWRALRATFAAGDVALHVCAPNAPGLVAGMLAVGGEAIWQLTLGVASLDATRAYLAARDVELRPAPGVPDGALIDPARACGARIVLRQDGA